MAVLVGSLPLRPTGMGDTRMDVDLERQGASSRPHRINPPLPPLRTRTLLSLFRARRCTDCSARTAILLRVFTDKTEAEENNEIYQYIGGVALHYALMCIRCRESGVNVPTKTIQVRELPSLSVRD